MNSLPVIRRACINALETCDADTHWRAHYCSIVTPEAVLELTENLETLLAHVDRTAPELALRIRFTLRLPDPLSNPAMQLIRSSGTSGH